MTTEAPPANSAPPVIAPDAEVVLASLLIFILDLVAVQVTEIMGLN